MKTFVYISISLNQKKHMLTEYNCVLYNIKICKYNEHFFIQCIVFLKESIHYHSIYVKLINICNNNYIILLEIHKNIHN